MNQKLQRFFEPDIRLFFSVLLLFAAGTLYFHLLVGVIELAAIGLLLVHYLATKSRRQKDMMQYVDKLTVQVDEAAKDTMLNAPLPMVIFRPDRDEIVWSNDKFLAIANEREHMFDVKLSGILPGFSTNWLLEGETRCPELVELHDKRFMVFGNLVRSEERGHRSMIATTYWVEVTDYAAIDEEYHNSRLVSAILCIDNYEEMFKNVSESVRSSLISEIEARLTEWTDQTGGIFNRYDRDHYLFFFEERYLDILIEQKFSVLDSIREVISPAGIAATLSIGIGRDAPGFAELYQYASLSLEMALSRGGDQAVVKSRNNFEFFGGRSKETEKRTKVKSRVMANALGELMSDASCVFVMGHKFPDLDAMGACVGICAMARVKGAPCYIIEESGNHPSVQLMEKLKSHESYREAFISEQTALEYLDSRSLVVVVDTSRPEQVQSLAVLESGRRVAVIDHHQRAATYIANAALNFHEPYASSACELICDLMQYFLEPAELLRLEAEAMMAGIVLDTKNFTLRTGSRTFEAAAYLRRAGADAAEVRKFFQNDLAGMVARYSIIQGAKRYHNGVAVAVVRQAVGRVTAAQAADEMINITDVNASFVLFPDEDGRVIISARSSGDINVQTILEPLHGGGNAAAAGAQIPDKTLEEVEQALLAQMEVYFSEDEDS